MKTSTANLLITRKIKHWLASIKDEEVRKLAEKNTILTGGSIVTLLTENTVNDFDLYFRTHEVTKAVATYYLSEWKKNPPARFRDPSRKVEVYLEDTSDRVKIIVKSAGVVSEASGDEGAEAYAYFEGDQNPEAQTEFLEQASVIAKDEAEEDKKELYRPVHLTSNAITLAGKIQIVIRFYGEPDQLHENYDFVHCTNYWTSWDRRLTLRPAALECMLTKELRYIGSRYPVCSLVRMRKFIQRGWTITAGQLLKIIFNLRQFDLTSVSVLEEQLTGVDTAYFLQLIEKLKEKDPTKVDESYLAELIDRIIP